MLSTVGLSVWRGGWAERVVAFGMVADSVGSAILQNKRDWSAPQWGDLAVDVAYLVLLLWVAFRSNRLWPLFAAAFQLVSVAIYGARLADWHVGARAPFAAIEIWSYLILVAVIVGVWQRGSRSVSSPPTGRSAT